MDIPAEILEDIRTFEGLVFIDVEVITANTPQLLYKAITHASWRLDMLFAEEGVTQHEYDEAAWHIRRARSHAELLT